MANVRWTSEDELWLIENYSLHTLQETSAILGRTLHAVQVKATELRKKGADVGHCIVKCLSDEVEDVAIDIPEEECDGYILEVRNSWKVLSNFHVKTKERIMAIVKKYGRGYNFNIRIIRNS